jgi:hypothetical protein
VKIRVADLGTQASMPAVRGHPCPRFFTCQYRQGCR